MARPEISGCTKRLRKLMKHLNSVESLTYEECWDIYGLKKKDMLERIYSRIAEAATRGY